MSEEEKAFNASLDPFDSAWRRAWRLQHECNALKTERDELLRLVREAESFIAFTQTIGMTNDLAADWLQRAEAMTKKEDGDGEA